MRTTLVLLIALAAAWPAAAQSWDNSGNSMLKGTYYFREIYYLLSDETGDVANSAVLYNTITFDGNGNYTGSTTLVVASQGSAPETIKGTYSIGASGYGFITEPLTALGLTATIWGGVSPNGVFIGSATASSSNYNNLFIAAPVASPAASAATLKGTYSVAAFDVTTALEANDEEGYGDEYILGSTFTINPDGNGNLGAFVISGYYGGGGSTVYTQSVASQKYTFSNGAASFTIPNSNNALTSGQKFLYISPDGNFIFGGGSAAWDFFVGVRTGTGTPNLSGLYYQAGIDEDLSEFSSDGYGFLDTYAGSFQTAPNGILLEHEQLIYENGLVTNPNAGYTFADTYSSGAYTDPSGVMKYVVGAGGAVRIGWGVGPYLGLNVAVAAPAVTPPSSGVWIDPQGVENGFSFAPFTAGISPGELITIFGNNLAPSLQQFSSVPLPTQIDGVQVNINGVPAPLIYVSPGQISALVPYATGGSIVDGTSVATISVTNQTASNTVTMLVNDTTPGVATQSASGVGLGAIQHASNYALVTENSPAQPGETVAVYVTGLGVVNPSIPDGSVAPTATLSEPTNTISVDISGTSATASSFLAPGSVALYQINVTIPSGLTAGDNVLDVEGPDSYTQQVVIPIGSGTAAVEPALQTATPAVHRKPHPNQKPPLKPAARTCPESAAICPGSLIKR